MARIRTIKPDFWTSEQVLNCSRDARLFFIGLWNFCDDGGVHPLKAKNLSIKIFPNDDDVSSETVLGYVDELSSNGLIGIFEHEDLEYIHVYGWSKHQRIDKARPSPVKPPKDRSHYICRSKNGRRTIVEQSATEGRKDGGREGSIDPEPLPPTTSTVMAGSGSLKAPPARPSDRPKPASTEQHGVEDVHGKVCVHYPEHRADRQPERLLWIDPSGVIDEVTLVRDLPPLLLDHEAVMNLRCRAMAEASGNSHATTERDVAKPPDSGATP